jgi:serine O-acetyltransferase
MFIWFLSNTVYKEYGINNLTNKLYYLNKTLHGFDCMADTNLPDIFLVQHGVGTMLGKAVYNNYFVVYQGCTVGANKGKYPIINQGVTLAANSSVIGACIVNKGTTISTRSLLFEKNTEENSIIYPNSTKISKIPFSQNFFNANVLF